MLKNKVAIITGGTRGIGLETVRLFKENHANVILFGSKKETVAKAAEQLKSEGFDTDGYYPDLNDYDEVYKITEQIYQSYGQIDILVNNAGISANKRIEDTTSSDFQKIIDINVVGIFNMTKAVVPFMKRNGGGVILNTSSMVSIYGQPSGAGYPTSKFAVNGLTKSLARELAPHHIRVNAVAPGVINTDMVAALPKEIIEPLIKTIPLGRVGEPRDIANAFLFLASNMASYITGEILSVDGAARS
ncbi:MAG: glucose 1-dehydrogenase [Oscillospiraceae bacterium]|nr:glucose 1-dehydrogenase [Oscillospiraceae bacterium]RKJ53899.1 glucose 1-dehydrogenase [bacterium 1XD42-8]RKJ63178.1 glucose 1-dehydrogenase [bacterium 1XD42-1]